MKLTQFILILFYIPVFLVSGYALTIFKRLERELKMLSWWLIITGVFHFVSFLIWLLHQNNLYVLHVLIPIRFLLLLLVYNRILQTHFPNTMVYIFGGGFICYSLLNSIFLEPIHSFNSMAMTVESIFSVILSLSAYILLMDKRFLQNLRISRKSVVWINGGVFIYYSSSLILMHFGAKIIQLVNAEWNRYTWIAHGIFMVIMYYCFWRALWNRKTT